MEQIAIRNVFILNLTSDLLSVVILSEHVRLDGSHTRLEDPARLSWDILQLPAPGKQLRRIMVSPSDTAEEIPYALAKSFGEPLLAKGTDFASTDIVVWK